MDIDQFISQHLEFLQRHHAVVHKRTTLAVGVELTPDNAFIKLRFDDTFVLAVCDGLAVRTCTENQCQST